MTQVFEIQFTTRTIDAAGNLQPAQCHTTQAYREGLDAEISLDLVQIPGGTFRMGTPRTEEGWHPSQNPQHEVTIAPFWMGQYPVTQQQWRVVAALPKVNLPLSPGSACFSGEQRPVEQVAWEESIEFCDRLSQLTGHHYRLPSEAEWEYACRAGTTTPFHFGETITTGLANYSGVDWEYQGKICSKGAYGAGPQGIDRRETTDVGSFGIANAFGLYDMHGLVREWCQDLWHPDYKGAPTDGTAWMEPNDSSESPLRVLRGGSWNSSPKACRSAYRGKLDPDSHLYDVGFRVVRSII